MTDRRRGFVHLVGAGPGDPELLTLKAARRIAEADVILLDALVDRGVLAHCKNGARVIEVGKRGGCRSTPQQFIERLMVRFARAGAIVVRVKGGDPLVFGRGGEEAIALKRAGIAFEIVPGVSSGLAAPACAGIPVTHRGVASAVTFVSGHGADGGMPDWGALVATHATLVIFMAVAAIGDVVHGLVEAGMPEDTPAAAIERATWPDQRVLRSRIAQLHRDAVAFDLRSPAILAVGQCVALADDVSIADMAAPAARAA